MRRFFCLWMIFSSLVFSSSISDKKASFAEKNTSQNGDLIGFNERFFSIKKEMKELHDKANTLASSSQGGENDGVFAGILTQINTLRTEKFRMEEEWRQSAVQDGLQNGSSSALWDQEEISLSQLVMEYGSCDYLYVIPPEIATMKLHLYSNIPIPRQGWSDLLEAILHYNGLGLKKLGSFARQIYFLRNDLGIVDAIVCQRGQLLTISEDARICYVLLPPSEQARSVLQFFEKFSDLKQAFVYQFGGRIALLGKKNDVEKLLDFYDQVFAFGEGKIARVVGLTKISAKEMEKILAVFFNEGFDKGKASFSRAESENLGVFSLTQSNSLVLMGLKESVDRAEKIIRETQGQMEDPAEMVIHLYTCYHSDPIDLAKILEKVYNSLLTVGQDKKEGVVQKDKGSLEGFFATAPQQPAQDAAQQSSSTTIKIDHFIPDPKTGTILMTVRRDSLTRLKDLLKKLDIPKKMVQIEVLLFERRLSSENNYGLNLLRLGNKENGLAFASHWGGPPVEDNRFVKGLLRFFFTGKKCPYFPEFSIAYNFLLTQDDVQLNAAPSIITVNQTPATISIMEEMSINNGVIPFGAGSKVTTHFLEKSFTRAQYGINMVLTPIIHMPKDPEERGFVTLKTDIKIDTTTGNKDDRPVVDKRLIQNEVCVVDGETVIIGGLRRKSKQDSEEKVHFLGDLLGIGKLFGSTKLTNHDTEMFFFITPKIIYDPEVQMEKYRIEELKKRPGDRLEFLKKIDEARDKQKQEFFRKSLKTLFVNDR
jgi:general secretion pathway protein D